MAGWIAFRPPVFVRWRQHWWLLTLGLGVLLTQTAQADSAASPGGIGCDAPVATLTRAATRSAPVSCQAAADTQVPGGGGPVSPTASSSADSGHDAETAARLDWQELTPPKHPYYSLCSGSYVEPPTPAGAVATDERLHVVSDELEYEQGKLATIVGDVDLRQGLRTLSADTARYDQVTGTVHAAGNIVLREPGLVVVAETSEMDLETKASKASAASYLIHDGRTRGYAEQLTRAANGDFQAKQAVMTRCMPGDGAWSVEGETVDIGAGERYGTVRDAVLRVAGVPVMYTPYLRFPTSDERQSGFLFPSLGYSDEDGTDIAIPYYLNLAPNYDATVTPRYLSERGAMVEVEGRHLARRDGLFAESIVGGAFLASDDLYDGTQSREEFDEALTTGRFESADRWLASIQHQGRWRGFRSLIDYTHVSDLDYFRDLGTNLEVTSQAQLDRLAEISYSGGNFEGSLAFERIQPLLVRSREPYGRLPEFSGIYRRQIGISPFSYSLLTQVGRFDRDNDDLTGFARAVGTRIHIEPRLEMALSRTWGFLNASTAYRHTRYDLDDLDDEFNSSPSRGLKQASLDAGLFFDRDANWFGTEAVQTLEPRAYYLYTEREDQSDLPLFDTTALTFDYRQLFRESRFSGIDRIGDAKQVALGVTSRWLNATTGVEMLRVSSGRIFHFRDREVVTGSRPTDDDLDSVSPWATEIQLAVARHTKLEATWIWDADDGMTTAARLTLRHRRSHDKTAFIAFSDQATASGLSQGLARSTRQAQVAAYWRLTQNVRFIGSVSYDFDEHRTLESIVGLEWDACCWRVRVVNRRFLKNTLDANSSEPDHGLFIQFQLKGLAGIGGDVSRVMEQSIPGYRELQPPGSRRRR